MTDFEHSEVLKLVMTILEESYLLLKREECERHCGHELRQIRDSALKIEQIMKGSTI